MQRYSGQPRDSIFIKGYGLLPFARNTGKNAGINISKNLTSIFSQKILDYAKKSAADTPKTASKGANSKTAEATDELIGNKIAKNLTRALKNFAKE